MILNHVVEYNVARKCRQALGSNCFLRHNLARPCSRTGEQVFLARAFRFDCLLEHARLGLSVNKQTLTAGHLMSGDEGGFPYATARFFLVYFFITL